MKKIIYAYKILQVFELFNNTDEFSLTNEDLKTGRRSNFYGIILQNNPLL